MELERAIEKFRQNDKKDLWYGAVYNLYQEGGDIEYVRDFRREMTKAVREDPSIELMDLLKKSYILTSRDVFDDFMISMEWDRPANEKFWLPRRKVLEGQHGLATKIDEFINKPVEDAYKLTLSCPPGVGKSTFGKFIIDYICGKFPKSMSMYCSYSGMMSDLMYKACVEMQTTDTYNFKEIFPGIGNAELSADNKSISYRGRSDAATITMVSTEGSVTGRTRADKFLITDDLVKNTEVAMSPSQLEKLYYTYTQSICTRMQTGCKEIMFGTIWSMYDPISREKAEHEGEKDYTFISIPVYDETTGKSNFLYDHPSAYTDEQIQKIKKRVDPTTFSCLYMQKGVEKEGLAFGIDRLRFYNGELPEGGLKRVFFHVDVAWGGSDSTAAPFLYEYEDGSIYCADVLFDRHDKSITQPRLVGKIIKHEANKGNVEANNGGSEYCEDISRMLREKGYSLNLTSYRAKRNMPKLTRIEQHQEDIRQIYFLDPALWDDEYRNFMNELTIFSLTTKNLHDDAPDALAGACDMLYSRDSRLQLYDRKMLFK